MLDSFDWRAQQNCCDEAGRGGTIGRPVRFAGPLFDSETYTGRNDKP